MRVGTNQTILSSAIFNSKSFSIYWQVGKAKVKTQGDNLYQTTTGNMMYASIFLTINTSHSDLRFFVVHDLQNKTTSLNIMAGWQGKG
jgi:hypothetical protein